jgi:hypothetical protein
MSKQPAVPIDQMSSLPFTGLIGIYELGKKLEFNLGNRNPRIPAQWAMAIKANGSCPLK